jgi:hypothetical protein
MTKRVAMANAGTLVAALMSGVVALTLGRGVVGVPARAAVAPKPIVKTETQVVTVTKRRRAEAAPVQTITVVRPGSGSVGSSGSTEYEDDGGEGYDD